MYFFVVRMASFLAAGYKTPLASVVFVAETASGPSYLIPALVAAVISYAVSGDTSVSDHQKLTKRVRTNDRTRRERTKKGKVR